MGTLIGAFWFYFGDAPFFTLVMETTWWKTLIIALLGYLMFPTPPSMDIRGWQEINSLNGAAWSLLWEYVANILYAVVIRRLTKIGLGIFVGLSACLTVSLCLRLVRTSRRPRRRGLYRHRRVRPVPRPDFHRPLPSSISILRRTSAFPPRKTHHVSAPWISHL